MTDVRITVIMGVYNCASTLPDALNSLLAQTEQRFKVVMCNDGSSDDTMQVAQEYADLYPEKFILISNDRNHGLGYTLNHCLEYADTEYVARMDGDDLSMPTRFEKEMNFLDANPEIAIVSTLMTRFDEQGTFSNPAPRKGYYPKLHDFIKGTPHCHAPCMVRTEAYKLVNGYDIEALRCEDYDLWFRMYAAGFRGYNIGEALYAMRDDRAATLRRTLSSRCIETRIIWRGIGLLRLPFFYRFWAIRPILVALLPQKIYDYLHKRKMRT